MNYYGKDFDPSYYDGDSREDLLLSISFLVEYKRIFTTAMRNAPKLPEPYILCKLGSGCGAKYPEDWVRGKHMQRELGLDVIPPKSEVESGAGLWDRITNGSWRNVHD